jgi:phage terminase large subunit GpA-like protein
MLAASDPKIKKVVIMACTQLMKTELINNIVGFYIHQDPSPIIVMQPTVSLAETWSKTRLDKMLENTPALQGIIKSKRLRDSGNNVLEKEFPGGQISMVGANSPTELASRPVRVVLCDETDKYPASAGKEGDPIRLIEERSETFFNAKTILVCSPTIKGQSRIEQEYLNSDQQVYEMPCPKCGHEHELQWENVKWLGNDPLTAYYECPKCTHQWNEVERLRGIKLGVWRATAPFTGTAGFRASKLISPWKPLSDLVKKFLTAEKSKDAQQKKTFINTQLARTYEEVGEAPDDERLYERSRNSYPINTCPKGVHFLTCGVDVQKNRLELEIVGWGKGKESWSIDYRVITGETATTAPWLELNKVLSETWQIEDGPSVSIKMLCVDSGFNTTQVYDWARKHPSNRVRAIKGRDQLEQIFGTGKDVDLNKDGKKLKRAVRVFPVGVSVLKTELYSWLNLKGAGDDGNFPEGYCHFPSYGENYFKGLTGEQLVTRIVDGKPKSLWNKTFEQNEPLDCRNYARAAAAMVGMDRFKENDWETIIGYTSAPPVQRPVINQPTSQQPTRQPGNPNRPQSGFWGKQKKSFW